MDPPGALGIRTSNAVIKASLDMLWKETFPVTLEARAALGLFVSIGLKGLQGSFEGGL